MLGSVFAFSPFFVFGLLMAYYVAFGALRMTLLATSPRQVQARVAEVRPEEERVKVKLHYSVAGEGFVKKVYLPKYPVQDGDLLTIDYAPGFPGEIRVPGQQPESWLMLALFVVPTCLFNAAALFMWSQSLSFRRRQRRLIRQGEAIEGSVVEREQVLTKRSSQTYVVVRSDDGQSYRIRTSADVGHRSGDSVTLLRDDSGATIYEDCIDESFVVATQPMI